MPPAIKSAKDIFLEAVEKTDPAERAHYLRQACGDDAELLRRVAALIRVHFEPDSLLDQERIEPRLAFPSMADPTLHQQPFERAGMQIGPYKILQQIGEGGMGVVYMAEQSAPVQRRVALKIIKPGMDTRQVIARFEAERQALAMMDHPNIAKVFDAGCIGEPGGVSPGSPPPAHAGGSQGRPYFVMELVRGIPITKYCDEHHLTLKQRLQLFLPVCHAVQHAHQKGIIHRDLKPSNVLVAQYDDKPVPKVIDFGVAKAAQKLTEQTMFTEFGQVLGTLEYMSPEQARLNQLDVDTRSDIYSLGVLLYELLTGCTPFDGKRLRTAAFDEMLRIIREEDPPRPSTRLSSADTLPSIAASRSVEPARLGRAIRGELDWIVMKALEKDRNRRYETTNGLARDIERYLSDEPVQACPPSTVYRFRKFARRNKGALLTAALLFGGLIVLVTGLALSNVRVIAERNEKAQALKDKGAALDVARESAARAEAESRRTRKNFLAARVAIREVITKAALGDEEWSQLPPPLRRRFSQEAARFYQGLIQDSRDPSDRFETAIAYRSLGLLHARQGSGMEDRDQAEGCYRKSISILDQLDKEYPQESEYREDLALCCRLLAGFLCHQLDCAPEADQLHRKAAELMSQLAAEAPESSDYGNTLASCLIDLQELSGPDAVEEYEQFLVKPAHLLLKRARAKLLADSGRRAEAEQLYRELGDEYAALAIESPALPEYRFYQAESLFRVGQLLWLRRQTAEAEKAYRQSIAVFESSAVQFPGELTHRHELGRSYNWLGFLLGSSGRSAEAEQAHRQAIEVYTGLVELADPVKGHWHRRELAWSRFNLGSLLNGAQRHAEAEFEIRSAFNLCQELNAEQPQDPTYRQWTAKAHWELGDACCVSNRLDEAEENYQRALQIVQKLHAENPSNPYYMQEQGFSERKLADAAERAGRKKGAESHLRNALAWCKKASAAVPNSADYRQEEATTLWLLAGLMLNDARISEAEAALEEASRLNQDSAGTHDAIGGCYARLGQWDKAAAEFLRSLELDPKNHEAWRLAAYARFAAGDTEGYRQTCRQLLERFGQSGDPIIAERTAKTCSLAADAVADFGLVERLAESSVTNAEKHDFYRFFVLARGLTECRAGRHAEAVKSLECFAPNAGGIHWDATAFAALAIAQYRLGRTDEARDSLAAAKGIEAEKMPDPSKGRPFGAGDWHDWLHAQILIHEAETMIATVTANSQTE